MKMLKDGYPQLRRRVVEALCAGGYTVGTAESCSGGLVAAALTDLPGSSAFFRGGVVAYANEAKVRLLGVAPETLDAKGAVSRETAEEMAMGCLKVFKTDFAVSVTGIAGPDGGSAAKPVGLVYFGVAERAGKSCHVFRHRFIGPRWAVRLSARNAALEHLLRAVSRVACVLMCIGLLGGAPAQAEGRLYGTPGGWGASTLERDGWLEVAPERWVGRLGADEAAEPPPPAPLRILPRGNIWGDCMLRTLSIRYKDMLEWSWSGLGEDTATQFQVRDPSGRTWPFVMEIEDVATGGVYAIQPSRRLQRGRVFTIGRKPSTTMTMYLGSAADGAISWQVIVAEAENGRLVMQGRVASMDNTARFLKCRIGLVTEAEALPILQPENPLAMVSLLPDGGWAGLCITAEEPRRSRAWTSGGRAAGFEFDLACSGQTINFPSLATFSVEVLGEAAKGGAAATPEQLSFLISAYWGGNLEIRSALQNSLPAKSGFVKVEPAMLQFSAPGGFQNSMDVFDFLTLRSSGLFADAAAFESAGLCLARRADREMDWRFDGDSARVWVNCDPDFETASFLDEQEAISAERVVNLQRNTAAVVHEQAGRAKQVWYRAMGADGADALDYQVRALRMTDYPAVWGNTEPRQAAVLLPLAEAELIASLSCVVKNAGGYFWIEDDGPWAPYTTLHADGLICTSTDEAEMRRQAWLAGVRPVYWLPETADAAARAVADGLGFIVPEETVPVRAPEGE